MRLSFMWQTWPNLLVRLFEEAEHGRDACFFEHCAVCHLVSPRDDQDASQAVHMETVEYLVLLAA